MGQSEFERFWSWFLSHEEALRAFDPMEGGYQLLRSLGEQLRKIDPDLTFELGPAGVAQRELTLSANGVRELIPLIHQLMHYQPPLEHWNVIAFRQRKKLEGGILSVREFQISPQDVLVKLELELRRIDLTLYVDHYTPEEYYSWLEIAFLLLDAAIGELDVATRVGEVCIQAKQEIEEQEEVFVLTELPKRFDAYLASVSESLTTRDELPAEDRRQIVIEQLCTHATAQAARLRKDPSFVADAVCLELYFRETDELDSGTLVHELRNECGYFVERVELGGAIGANSWIHCWFDQSRTVLNQIAEVVKELAQRGASHGCELEGVFLSPAEQIATLDSLFASLELVPGSQAAMHAHQEIEAGNIESAISVLEEALEEDPENIELRGLLAYSYAKVPDEVLAEECLEELSQDLKGDKENPATFWNIACAYALLQDAKKACESLQIAFELDPALREVAIADPDLAPLKGQPDFDKLIYQA